MLGQEMSLKRKERKGKIEEGKERERVREGREGRENLMR